MSSAKVADQIMMLFGMVTWVAKGPKNMTVLDGGPNTPKEGALSAPLKCIRILLQCMQQNGSEMARVTLNFCHDKYSLPAMHPVINYSGHLLLLTSHYVTLHTTSNR